MASPCEDSSNGSSSSSNSSGNNGSCTNSSGGSSSTSNGRGGGASGGNDGGSNGWQGEQTVTILAATLAGTKELAVTGILNDAVPQGYVLVAAACLAWAGGKINEWVQAHGEPTPGEEEEPLSPGTRIREGTTIYFFWERPLPPVKATYKTSQERVLGRLAREEGRAQAKSNSRAKSASDRNGNSSGSNSSGSSGTSGPRAHCMHAPASGGSSGM